MTRMNAHRARLWLFGFTTLLIMIAIFWFSSQNAVESQELSDGFLASLIGAILNRLLPRLSDRGMEFDIRKYAHMAEFLVLGSSSFLFLSECRGWTRDLKAAFQAFLFSILYACTDEFHQIFVPGRAGRFTDVLVDGIGITLGILALRGIQWVHEHRENRKKKK